jgi:hypothetical protein
VPQDVDAHPLPGGLDLANGVECGATALARRALGIAEAPVTLTRAHVEDPAVSRIDEQVDVASESLGYSREEATGPIGVAVIDQSG